MMTIIIMNLLIGLAVDDIKAVQEKAKLKKLAMQVHIYHFLRSTTYSHVIFGTIFNPDGHLDAIAPSVHL